MTNQKQDILERKNRISDIKRKVVNKFKSDSCKAGMWKTLALSALVAVSGAAKASPNEPGEPLPHEDDITNMINVRQGDNNENVFQVALAQEDGLENLQFEGTCLVLSPEILDSLQVGENGRRLSRQARFAQRKINDETHCYRAVKLAVRSASLGNLTGVSAWEAADQLRENTNFVEVVCEKQYLDQLPDGAIIVYGKGKTRDGHVGCVVNGKDVSSKVRNVNTRGTRKGVPYGEISVFLPNDTLLYNQPISEIISQYANNEQQDNQITIQNALFNAQQRSM